jgi:hypothetical protein
MNWAISRHEISRESFDLAENLDEKADQRFTRREGGAGSLPRNLMAMCPTVRSRQTFYRQFPLRRAFGGLAEAVGRDGQPMLFRRPESVERGLGAVVECGLHAPECDGVSHGRFDAPTQITAVPAGGPAAAYQFLVNEFAPRTSIGWRISAIVPVPVPVPVPVH